MKNHYKLISISPNPENSQIQIDYDIENSTSAYIMVTGVANGVSNNYVLNTNSVHTTISLANYQTGYCDSQIVESKNLIKMKNLILILFLFTGLLVKAQQQELIENTWYLEKLVIEGEEFLAPTNEEVNNVVFRYVDGNYTFSTTVCAELILGFELLDDNSFWGTSIMYINELCTQDENHYFEYKYFDFFWNSGIFEEAFYEYQIIPENEELKLIISAGPTTKAYYSNQSLSISETSNAPDFQLVFQNEDLIIKGFKSVGNSVSIYDLNGKLIMNAKINTRNLPKGIYVVKIRDEKGWMFSKKLLKN